MRCLGQIDGRSSAEAFVAYLLTQEISTHIETLDAASDRWEVWVRDEDKLQQAQRELAAYQANPRDAKYSAALATAREILAKKEKARQQAARNVRRLDASRRPNLAGGGPLPPLTLTLLIVCVAVSLFSNFSRPKETNEWGKAIVEQLSFVSIADYVAANDDPAASLKRGELWRAITPIFLHMGIFHLAMNMFVLVSFGRMVERWVGTPRFALFVLLLAIAPNLLQGLAPEWMQGSPFFGGISGVLYGLFGFVWIRSTLNPTLGVSIPFPIVVLFVGMIVVGLSGIVPNWQYADLCHLGGLLIGSALGYASEQKGR
ncbi:MAG: rhomboid family intramembrane serine protease [Planctomycetales bacterium]|nr:rhomboid family intramembrane serine protease [Planctomycetales bacterium]